MPDRAANPWEDSLIADVRANGGRPSGGPLAGHPLLLMWSTGAKSGLERRSILTYSRDGADYVVAGTKSGAPDDPFWVANVEAHPTVRVEAANETFEADAAVLRDGAERDRLWAQHVAELPHFGKYEDQVRGHRTIPVIRLRRIEA
ncbi:MAG: nitroreductase family deazaflavin-dependent oxidoreductase [Chloroflexi bacterium]|nr:nitroreductase family deazaflavin-dependent oxidoreductase [Chloroflexota bacterium]